MFSPMIWQSCTKVAHSQNIVIMELDADILQLALSCSGEYSIKQFLILD